MFAMACTLKPSLPFNAIPELSLHFHQKWPDSKWTILFTNRTFFWICTKHLVTFTINLIFWQINYVAGGCMLLDFFIGPVCLSSCEQISRQRYESHFASGCKGKGKNDLPETIIASRITLLLADIYNELIGTQLIACLVVLCMCQIIPASLLLNCSVRSGIVLPLKMLYLCFVLDTLAIVFFAYGLAANLHYISIETLRSLRSNQKLMRDKCLKRVLTSCRELKVKLGEANFLERTTPLIVEQFCITWIINLVLVIKP